MNNTTHTYFTYHHTIHILTNKSRPSSFNLLAVSLLMKNSLPSLNRYKLAIISNTRAPYCSLRCGSVHISVVPHKKELFSTSRRSSKIFVNSSTIKSISTSVIRVRSMRWGDRCCGLRWYRYSFIFGSSNKLNGHLLEIKALTPKIRNIISFSRVYAFTPLLSATDALGFLLANWTIFSKRIYPFILFSIIWYVAFQSRSDLNSPSWPGFMSLKNFSSLTISYPECLCTLSFNVKRISLKREVGDEIKWDEYISQENR